MFRRTMLVAALAVAGLCAVARAEAPAQIFNEVSQSLAHLEYNYVNDIVGTQKKVGQAICVDEAKGIFITFEALGSFPADELKDFTLTPPGVDAQPVKAELIGVDPEHAVAFLHATDKHSFKAVKLDFAAKVDVGQEVYSVGLMGSEAAYAPYLGVAKVSAMAQLPNRLAMVTAGDLCVLSSPVLNADGKVIGLITPQQIVGDYRFRTPDGQTMDVGLTSNQNSRTFALLADFQAELSQLPATKDNIRKMPWIGIFSVRSPAATEADVLGLAGKGVVIVDRLLPGGPADKAGIKQNDPIVGVNGQPLVKMAVPELTPSGFIQRMWDFKPSDKVTFTVFRDKAPKDIQVTLENMPPSMSEAKRYYNRNLAIAAREMQMWDRYATARPTPLETQGVVVIGAPQGGAAAKAGLKPGDLITQLNDKPVTNVADLDSLVKAAGKGDLKFQVMRADKPEIVVIRQ